MDGKLRRLLIVTEVLLRIVWQADPYIAWVGDDKPGLAAEYHHEGTNIELLIVVKGRALHIPLQELIVISFIAAG